MSTIQRSVFPPLTATIKLIVGINVGVFVVAAILSNFAGLDHVVDHFTLRPADVFPFKLWQPFTYMWLHSLSSTGHLLWNMVLLWLFGVGLEQMWGSKRLLRTYVISGLGAAALIWTSALAWHLFPTGNAWLDASWSARTVGASGAVSGVMAAWCGVLWNQHRNFLLLGSIKINYFFYFLVGLEVLGGLTTSNVSTAGHLGGLATGWLIGRGYGPKDILGAWRARQKVRQLEKDLGRFTVYQGGKNDDDEYIH